MELRAAPLSFVAKHDPAITRRSAINRARGWAPGRVTLGTGLEVPAVTFCTYSLAIVGNTAPPTYPVAAWYAASGFGRSRLRRSSGVPRYVTTASTFCVPIKEIVDAEMHGRLRNKLHHPHAPLREIAVLQFDSVEISAGSMLCWYAVSVTS